MKNFNDIDLKLCHCCGTCIGVCPTKAIEMVDGLPRLTGKCIDCGLCYEGCPGIEFCYPEFNKRFFETSEVDNEIGHYRSIHTGYATNKAVRKKGASGGVVTAVLSGLLRRREIGGAIVVGMNKTSPWIPEVKVATSEDDVFNAAQSKYSIVSVNEILNRLDTINGDLVFVGLPCHVHGIRKLQKMNLKIAKRIKYCIGVFCGFNMERRATDFLIQKFKVKKEEIGSLEYRGGDWPGGFSLITKDGRNYFIEKHFYNYLNLIFVPKRCLVCPDLTNEFADLAVGDAWNKDLGFPGWSTIIVRTQGGQELIDRGVKAKDIDIRASDKQNLREGHAHLILYKKKGVLMRQKLMGLNPKFDLNMPLINIKENVFNVVFFYLVSFMKTNFTVALFRFIPIRLPGLLSKYARLIINLIFRPRKIRRVEIKGDGIFNRIKKEYKYLKVREWSFRDVGDYWDSVVDYDNINKETYSYYRRFIDGYKYCNIPNNSYILDLCSRTGNGTLFFWTKGNIKKATCADFSEKMQVICADRLKEAGILFEQKLVEAIPLPFKDEEFDAALCFETIEHVSNPKDFIRELARVIKDKGQVVLTTPNVLWGPIHSLAAIFNIHHSEGPHRFISRNKLHQYIRDAGFEIVIEKTTVLIPAGPKFLVRLGEWIEQGIGRRLMPLLGLRRIFICKKK